MACAWENKRRAVEICPLIDWQIDTAAHLGEFYIGGEETNSTSLFFKPDGTRLFVTGTTGDAVVEYDIPTPWQISTATYNGVGREFSVAAETGFPLGLFFKSDGTRMFVVSDSADTIVEYDLSTPWQVSTAIYNGVDREFSVAPQDSNPRGLFFKPDGTRMFVVGRNSRLVMEYALSTPWQVNTAIYFDEFFSVASETLGPSGLFFADNGMRMFISEFSAASVIQYDLSAPWQVSTATYDGVSFSVASEETTPLGLFFKPDGTRMFIVGPTDDAIVEYDLATS